MGPAEKQARACRAIGIVIGVDPKAYYDDCMEGDETDHPTVKTSTIGLVDDFYGPQISFSGSLYSNRGAVRRDSSYSVTANATGHGTDQVTASGTRENVSPKPSYCSLAQLRGYFPTC